MRSLEEIRDFCKRELAELEFWPSYYDRRFTEFLSYQKLLPDSRLGHVLEVGCGNGFYAALLSTFSEHVTATDVESSSNITHDGGLAKARRLTRRLNLANVEIKPADVQNLPFPDRVFDYVFSFHVLIYPANPARAIREMHRVLKPGGYCVMVMPTRAQALYRVFDFQIYIIKRSFVHLGRRLRAALPSRSSPANSGPEKNPAVSLRRGSLRSFPFPPSLGGLPHWRDEFKQWTPDRWRSQVLANAPDCAVVHQSTTQLTPLLPLLGSLIPSLATRVHQLTRAIEARLGRAQGIQRFGQNTVIISQKALTS